MKGYVAIGVMLASLSVAGHAQPASVPFETSPVAESYAVTYGVSVTEARRRIAMLPVIVAMDRRLRREAPTQYAGLWVDHAGFRVKVRMLATGPHSLRDFTTDPMFVAEDATVSLFTLEQVERRINTVMTVLRLPMDEGIDIRHGTIDVAVLDSGRARTVLGTLLRAHRFISVRQVKSLMANTATIIGGRLASGSTENCTTGYSVRGAAGDGITTAGHCDSTISVSGRTQTLQARNYSNSTTNGYDLQWNRNAGDTYPNQVQIRTNGTLMTIASTYDAKSLPVNWPLCKFGQTTGYTCGEVVGQQNATDNNGIRGRFIRVRPTGSGAMTVEGDSGGPVFGDQTAYGTVKGRGGSSNPNDMYFMSVSDFAPLNISVKTSS